MTRDHDSYLLTNCDIFTGESVEMDRAILVRDGLIDALVPLDQLPAGVPVRDLGGQSVAPGFIDLQVNGGGGVLFNDQPSPEGIRRIAEAHRRFGTTNLLPTFITGPTERMQEAADAVRRVLDDGDPSGVLGIHFEGPFIARSKAGVHDKSHVRQVNEADLSVIRGLQGRGATLLTLAPEEVPSSLVSALCEEGVIVAIGHSNATCEQALAAFHAGARCTTHLYNAMSALSSRAPGVVGAALDDRGSWTGIIADGFHADFLAVRVAVRAKARRKVFLVTDAMPPVGSSGNGSFRLGPYDIRLTDGRCTTEDGTLAGSALDMATAVRNCIQKIGIPKDEALRMASTYPAEFIGRDQDLGYIAPGYRANLVVFNNQISVSAVVVEGEFLAVS